MNVEELAAELERRVAILESAAKSKDTSNIDGQQLHVNLLPDLANLHTALTASLKEVKMIETENARLKEEVSVLKKEIDKKAYRIEILSKSVEELKNTK